LSSFWTFAYNKYIDFIPRLLLSEWKLLSILHSLDDKKLIKELFLINILIISLIFLSFKGYQIYLLDVKEYLFYFDDQQIYRNRCVDLWTDLTTYQCITFRIIISWISHSNPPFFLISVYCRKIKRNFPWVRPGFHDHTIHLFCLW
jgi:hypothetical protein